MLWGIFVHAGTLGNSTAFNQLSQVSGWFRMEAFFVVSGLFSYMLIRKYDTKTYLYRRVISLGVPLLVALIFLNPITNFLIYIFHNTPISFLQFLKQDFALPISGPFIWHLHLWFLFVLIIYSFLTPLLYLFIKRLPELDSQFSKGKNAFLTFGIITFLGCVATLGGRVLFEFFVESRVPGELNYIIRSLLYFIPFYFLGMYFFHSKSAMQSFHRPQWAHLFLAIIAMVVSDTIFDLLPKQLAETLKLCSEFYFGLMLSNLMFYLFSVCFSKKNNKMRVISDSAYSVYLLHFIIIYSFASLLHSSIKNSTILMVIVSLLTLIVTISFYCLCIRHSKVLLLLLNGKWSYNKK